MKPPQGVIDAFQGHNSPTDLHSGLGHRSYPSKGPRRISARRPQLGPNVWAPPPMASYSQRDGRTRETGGANAGGGGAQGRGGTGASRGAVARFPRASPG